MNAAAVARPGTGKAEARGRTTILGVQGPALDRFFFQPRAIRAQPSSCSRGEQGPALISPPGPVPPELNPARASLLIAGFLNFPSGGNSIYSARTKCAITTGLIRAIYGPGPWRSNCR